MSSLQTPADHGGLVATGLGKQFKKRPVVRNVSLSVKRGEAVGLLGPNGAGKTTTFYMLVGLIQADSGTITLDGVDISTLPMYRRARLGIGYLPQEASVFRGLTVEQNIAAAIEVVEPDRDHRAALLDELLAEFGISHLRRTPALALSGGERRRVEIARALATEGSLLLLDEPAAGMNPQETADLMRMIRRINTEFNATILLIEHDMKLVMTICQHLVVMDHGSVIAQG
ncbi:MAG TPA: LPS export ABC transporter ATP-binding protein, partial [Acidocella sp.]|nr:LPS export ABC transporter ATP-binding protein [Acidocella sp.]